MAENKDFKNLRNVVELPTSFEDGFSWKTLLGVIFVGLIMVPGVIYMDLLGGASMFEAAQWVTVILFIEVARRAQQNLKKAEVFVIFYMVAGVLSSSYSNLLWRQFYPRSDAAMAFGITKYIPGWASPNLDSDSYVNRTFLHIDWLPVVIIIMIQFVITKLNRLLLGMTYFKLLSDRERLPFPVANIEAEGISALSEDLDEKNAENEQYAWRWRVFSIGGAIGMVTGAIYLFLPTITGALTGSPIIILPIPFVDLTEKTYRFLPAVAIGINWNFMFFFYGFVLHFWAVIGTAAGILMTFIANPILYKMQVLNSWTSGDDTITTLFKNYVNFYFSFGLGVSGAVAVIGMIKAWQSIKEKKDEDPDEERSVLSDELMKERGNPPFWLLISLYLMMTAVFILISGYLVDWHRGVMLVLVFLGVFYAPFINYITARTEGIAGHAVEVPLVREASLILSGYEGVGIWFLPIPQPNYGLDYSMYYRQVELTGTKFSSIWKAEIIITPVVLISSVFYMNYIWSLAEIPSTVYPYAQEIWDLWAANRSIMISATLGEYSIFEQAFRWKYIFTGAAFGTALFGITGWLGAPVFFAYGVIRALNEVQVPHTIFLMVVGALLSRFYFEKKFGKKKWMQYAPVITAGFACGEGLVAMIGFGLTFLTKASIKMPF